MSNLLCQLKEGYHWTCSRWSTTRPYQSTNCRWFPQELSQTHSYQSISFLWLFLTTDIIWAAWIICCSAYTVCLLSTFWSDKHCWRCRWRWTPALYDRTKRIILGNTFSRKTLTWRDITVLRLAKGNRSQKTNSRNSIWRIWHVVKQSTKLQRCTLCAFSG